MQRVKRYSQQSYKTLQLWSEEAVVPFAVLLLNVIRMIPL